MIARMTSLELTKWQAYHRVLAEEWKHERDVAESGDGVVIVSGLDTDDDDSDDEDGETD